MVIMLSLYAFQNLVVKIPENASDEEAAFTVIGAIGFMGFVC